MRNGTTTTAKQSSCAAGRSAAVNPPSVTLRRVRRVVGSLAAVSSPGCPRVSAHRPDRGSPAVSGVPPLPLAGILAGCEGAGFAGSGRVAAGCGRSGWRAVGSRMVAPTPCAPLALPGAARSGIFLDGRGCHLERAFEELSLSGTSPRGCPRRPVRRTRCRGAPWEYACLQGIPSPAGCSPLRRWGVRLRCPTGAIRLPTAGAALDTEQTTSGYRHRPYWPSSGG